ncbi:ABC-2 type transporter [Corchorus olitorius]|uniref:ABC-2 type transporter n=1 Tax=Corchorus olitorius TaxID=93759 RepID=A0A1R3KP95_9ROSI|nr:ABC-2 type transporter [Corchorus olitorius]
MWRKFLAIRNLVIMKNLIKVAIEIPYLLAQTVLFVTITYGMIGYHVTAAKVFWYFYGIFFTVLYFNLLGMLLVSLTPDLAIAQALTATCYPMLNLFCGFLIPKVGLKV